MSTELDTAIATHGAATPRITRVIVALELDERGQLAARWGRRLATDLGVDLEVIGSKLNATVERDRDVDRRLLAESTDELANWLGSGGIVADSLIVAETSLEDEIMSEVGVGDLLVMGVHHREGVTSWALGSLPHDLAHRLTCPLVLIPPDAVIPEGDAPVLVGIDGSDHNRRVVEWSKVFAAAVGRPLEAVYGRDPMYDTFDAAGNLGDAEWEARLEAEMEGVLLHERADLAEHALRDVAHERHAYLTVVGVREHHSLGGVLLGRLVDHLIHTPPGPIAILSHDATEHLRADTSGVSPHAAEVAAHIRRLVVPTDAEDESLERCRAVALDLAKMHGFEVVLYDRSTARWAQTPVELGPLGIDDLDAETHPQLVAQMREFRDAGVNVRAHLASTPTITAIVETVECDGADAIMMPEQLDHPRLLDRLNSTNSHTAELVDHVATLAPHLRPALFIVSDHAPLCVFEHTS
jgi:nucleotide-binding universal stress UspA family protein